MREQREVELEWEVAEAIRCAIGNGVDGAGSVLGLKEFYPQKEKSLP
jgi:hypothetical protein